MSNALSIDQLESPQSFLDEVYRELDYQNGTLLNAASHPDATYDEEVWLEKGDWLALSYKVGAEKVLFVNNDPVIVFCKFQHIPNEKELLDQFRRVWCMARPRCLYIAFPGELRVYSLNQLPTQDVEDLRETAQLALLRKVTDVVKTLHKYRREQVESYHLFEDERFGTLDQRADKRLIEDLKIVRESLLNKGLEPQYAHALIGRSIFIRYLEDREVLTPRYFEEIAEKNPHWQYLLSCELDKPDLTQGQEKRCYYRVLLDKGFTDALFDKLAEDFNGDMFPKNDLEKNAVDGTHLKLIHQFLLGDADEQRPKLFFWAYDFEIIPIELISNIYEEFYHISKEVDDKGTHYTPSMLVEHVLSQVLTGARLAGNPRILDPACGSGIFLVESFRRIVRYRVMKQEGKPLPSSELKAILRDQIAGIEINEEAIRIAAFSLYLALLHYQTPPSILEGRPLPNLIYQNSQKRDEQHFQILHHSNAFALTQDDVEILLQSLHEDKGRENRLRLLRIAKKLALNLHSFDVVVGNPPWSGGSYIVSCGTRPALDKMPPPFVYNKENHTLSASKDILPSHIAKAKQTLPLTYHDLLDELKLQSDENAQAIRWAEASNRPIGDKSYSQLFIYRSLSFLKEDGCVGLLVHASVIFNQSPTSRAFRQCWLSLANIIKVMNFVRVRRLFFSKAIAPFIFVVFSHKHTGDSYIEYISAHLTKHAEQLRSVMLSKADRRLVRQSELQAKDYLWKTYWWGNHHDAALLGNLDWEQQLKDILSEEAKPGYGFQRGSDNPSITLQTLKPLGSKKLKWYGPLREEWFEEKPKGVKRDPNESIYYGQRLVVGRGARSEGVTVRLEYEDFSFRHIIYSIPLPSLTDWQAKIIIGTIWSSLGKYRLFMTSGRWGTWHDEIVSTDILSMPIRLPQQNASVAQVIRETVDAIRLWEPLKTTFGDDREEGPPSSLLERLDQAVFDLFELSDTERELIKDFVTYKFGLFSDGANSKALNTIKFPFSIGQGTRKDLVLGQRSSSGFGIIH